MRRRLREELGVGATRLERIYAFDYRASFLDRGTEHEFCHVFLAQLDEEQRPTVHAAEIMDWAWYELTDVDALMKTSPDTLTPWFCLEWQMLRGRYASVLAGFAQGHSPRSAA